MWVSTLVVIIVSLWAVVAISWGVSIIWQGKIKWFQRESTEGNASWSRPAQLIGFGITLIFLLNLITFLFLLQPNFLPLHLLPFVGGAILGVSLIFILIVLISPDPASRCPQCHKFGVKEDLREELVGIFEKGAMISRHRWEVVPHEKYNLYHRCKSCGYEWMSTKVKRL